MLVAPPRHGADRRCGPGQGAQKLPDRSDHGVSDTAGPQAGVEPSKDQVDGDEALLSRPRQGEQAARHDLVVVSGRLAATACSTTRPQLACELPQPDAVPQLLGPAGLLQVGGYSSSVVMLPTKGIQSPLRLRRMPRHVKTRGCWIARSTRAMTRGNAARRRRDFSLARRDCAADGRRCYAASRSIGDHGGAHLGGSDHRGALRLDVAGAQSPCRASAAIAWSIRSASLPMAKE